jgi:hypothetical protein
MSAGPDGSRIPQGEAREEETGSDRGCARRAVCSLLNSSMKMNLETFNTQLQTLNFKRSVQ